MESIVFSCLSTEISSWSWGTCLVSHLMLSSLQHTLRGPPLGFSTTHKAQLHDFAHSAPLIWHALPPSSASFPRKLILLFLTQFRLLQWTLSGFPQAKWAAIFCTFQHSSYTWILSLEEDPFNNVRVCFPSRYTENSWWLRTNLRKCVPSPLMKTYLESPFLQKRYINTRLAIKLQDIKLYCWMIKWNKL